MYTSIKQTGIPFNKMDVGLAKHNKFKMTFSLRRQGNNLQIKIVIFQYQKVRIKEERMHCFSLEIKYKQFRC